MYNYAAMTVKLFDCHYASIRHIIVSALFPHCNKAYADKYAKKYESEYAKKYESKYADHHNNESQAEIRDYYTNKYAKDYAKPEQGLTLTGYSHEFSFSHVGHASQG